MNEMMKRIIFGISIIVLVISNAQAMTSSPSTLVLEGNTGEWINGTIHFSDVPTKTLSGYEKWTEDGATLNKSLTAKDGGVVLKYPKSVMVEDGEATINISARTEECGEFVGAVFYRTEGQTGISAGTWIKINISEGPIEVEKEGGLLSFFIHALKRVWDWISGLFSTAEASGATMNTTVNITVTPTPYRGGGGGGGGAPRDSDGDGHSDIQELLAGTDWKDPCNPNTNCAACLAIKSPSPTSTPTPPIASTPPTTLPTIVTPTQQPAATPTPSETVVLVEKKLSRWWIVVAIVVIGTIVGFVLWRERWRW